MFFDELIKHFIPDNVGYQWARIFCEQILTIQPTKAIFGGSNQHYFDLFFLLSIAIAIILFVIAIILELYKLVVFGSGSYLHIVTRFVLVGLCLTCYPYFINASMTGVNWLVKKTVTEPVRKQLVFAEQISKARLQKEKMKEEAKRKFVFDQKTAETVVKNVGGVAATMLFPTATAAATFLANLDRFLCLIMEPLTAFFLLFIMLERNIMIILLYFFGPIGISLFVIPGLASNFWSWLRNWIYVLLWPLVAGIIIIIQATLMETAFKSGFSWEGFHTFMNTLALFFVLLSSCSLLPSIFSSTFSTGGATFSIFKIAQTVGGVALTTGLMVGGTMLGGPAGAAAATAVSNTVNNTANNLAQTVESSSGGEGHGPPPTPSRK